MNTLYTVVVSEDTTVLSKRVAYLFIGLGLYIGISDAYLLVVGAARPEHFNWWAMGFTFVSAFLINPLFMILGTRSSLFKLAAIAWIQIMSGVMLLFFTEIYGPFTSLWSMMILLSAIYDGWRGFAFSSGLLVTIATAYCLLFAHELKPDFAGYVTQTITLISFTIVVSYFFTFILMASRKKNHDLLVSQKSEILQVNRLNTLLNSISDAVLTLNRYGRVTSQNAAAQAFFDTNQSLVGRDLERLLVLRDHEDQAVSVHDLMHNVKATLLRDDLSIGSGGNTQHLSIQISRIRSTFDDNEEYGVVVIIRDITKQKTLEEEKDEFISVTSHELRTPIAIAEGSLSNLMVMHGKHADRKQLEEATKTSYDQIIYLAKIINDLSTLSRAERGVSDAVEDIDVKVLLHELYSRYEAEAQAKSLQLNLAIDGDLPHVETSRLYLEEILQNFITNAIKYTKEGSVTITANMLENGQVMCSVKDTGIGMSKSDLEHVFEKFYRSEDYRTRETSGTGLGLYVVQKLADKLETKIEVESRIDHGSTFSFVLPLKSIVRKVSNAPVIMPTDDGGTAPTASAKQTA